MPPHRKLVTHVHEPGQLHEFTFSCFHRKPLLTNDRRRSFLAESIDAAGDEFSFQLVAFVFMPEHVHLLTLPLDAEPAIDHYLAAVKRPVSARVKLELERSGSRLLEELTILERPGKSAFRFWQEGPGYDRNVFTSKVVLGVIDYIHANPVRRRLCKKPDDWPWSSARWFASDCREVDPRHPKLTPLPAEFGWAI
jgi:putative transposase